MVPFRAQVGWVECVKIQHSPSSAANPKVQRMDRDLMFWERFHEDVCSHFVSWAILDVNTFVCNSLTDVVEAYVDMLRSCMVIIVSCKMKGGLVVTEQSNGSGDGAKERFDELSEPYAFFGCMSRGHVFSFSSG